jgi:geranylgeranyl diphosphate synthase type II
MIHTYSLIHDDLPALDNDDLRRGKPSSHKAFGEDMAILAGDALLNDAFHLVLKYSTTKSLKGAIYLAKSSGGRGMVLGQVLDCKISENKRDLEILDNINLLKTGKMLMASTAGTALWCGANEKTVNILENYGKNIGLAFQITDDILDITSNEEMLGKPIGSDSKLNKSTYPSILGLDNAKKRAETFVKQAKNELQKLEYNEFVEMLFNFSDYIIERKF